MLQRAESCKKKLRQKVNHGLAKVKLFHMEKCIFLVEK